MDNNINDMVAIAGMLELDAFLTMTAGAAVVGFALFQALVWFVLLRAAVRAAVRAVTKKNAPVDVGWAVEELMEELAEMPEEELMEEKRSRLFAKPDQLNDFLHENEAIIRLLVDEVEFFNCIVEEDEIEGTTKPVIMFPTINLMMGPMTQSDEFALNLALRFKKADTTSSHRSKLFKPQGLQFV